MLVITGKHLAPKLSTIPQSMISLRSLGSVLMLARVANAKVEYISVLYMPTTLVKKLKSLMNFYNGKQNRFIQRVERQLHVQLTTSITRISGVISLSNASVNLLSGIN